MSLAATLVAALLGGLALGAVYFAALDWSVRRLLESRGGAASMALSLVLRLALAAAVFLVAVRGGGWPALLAALGGFLIVRTAVTWRRPAQPQENSP
jgi:F1F0 ATPase subunit 2